MAENILSNLIQFIPQVKGSGFQQLNKGLMSTHKNLFSLRNMFGAFFGYDLYSSIRNAVPAMVEVSQKIGAMESRFRAVSTSAKAGADELGWVAQQSRRLGLDFLNTADNYSIFFATLKNTMGQGQTRQIFEQWSEAFRVLHVPKEQQSRVLYALREMSSKGKIYMQDLALQLGNAVPDAMGLAAKAMGYTGTDATNRFRKAIKDGDIDVKKFLVTFSNMVNKTYVDSNKLAEAMNKPDAQLQTMAANMQLFQIAMTKAGFEKDLVKFLKSVNVLLPKLERHAHGIYKAIKLIAGLILTIGLAKGFWGLIRMFQDAKLVFQIMGMAKGLKQMAEAIKLIQIAGAAGQIGASGSLIGIIIGALTNPWILGIILVTGLTIALGFVIKKFFPNVWSAIMSIWIRLKILIWNLIDDINNHPAIMAMKQWFGTEKKGFGKNVQDKQNAWAQRFPNHEFIFNVGGALDAANMWAYNKAMNLTPLTKGMNFARQVGPALTKYVIEQKYKIDVKVDGVEDKKTIMDSVHDAISNFAEQNKKKSAMDIINSRLFGKNPFAPA